MSEASIVPEAPRVVVGLARQHHTWNLVEASGAFALHLITADRAAWVWRFGLGRGATGTSSPASRRDAQRPVPRSWRAPSAGSIAASRHASTRATARSTWRRWRRVSSREGEPLTVAGMLALASPEQRQALELDLSRDAAIDREAIARWRARQQGPGRSIATD
ncbi:MAG: hypothetical protein MZW92_01725 [Comamonadaceae bacterium]|nr:hypothetical protein [Comamonadaceae bacterium]